MCPIQLQIDAHTSHRLEALTLLQQEIMPDCPVDPQSTLREALKLGLDLMLGEALASHRKPLRIRLARSTAGGSA